MRVQGSAATWVAAIAAGMAVAGCQNGSSTGRGLDQNATGHVLPRAAAELSAANVLQLEQWRHAVTTAWFGDSLPDNPASPPVPPTPDVPDRWRTRARLAWDPEHLLVLVESEGPTPVVGMENKDGPVHQGDVCEVFLDVAGKQQDIVEVQVGPTGRSATYFHHWDKAPAYPADRLDDVFYHANHHVDPTWRLEGLQARSSMTPVGEGRTSWLAAFIIPLAQPLERAGLAPVLHSGQTLRVNILRYAYERKNGKNVFRQYNLVPTKHGCPHQSPMATMPFTAAD